MKKIVKLICEQCLQQLKQGNLPPQKNLKSAVT